MIIIIIMKTQQSPSTLTPGTDSESEDLRIVDSSDLLRGERLVLIRHNGQIYRLQLTRSDKLILTK